MFIYRRTQQEKIWAGILFLVGASVTSGKFTYVDLSLVINIGYEHRSSKWQSVIPKRELRPP